MFRLATTLFLLAVAVPAGAFSVPEDSPSPVPTPFTFYCSRCDPGPSGDRAGHNQVCLDCTNQDEPCEVTRDCVTPVITCASCVGSPHHLETCHGCQIEGTP